MLFCPQVGVVGLGRAVWVAPVVGVVDVFSVLVEMIAGTTVDAGPLLIS